MAEEPPPLRFIDVQPLLLRLANDFALGAMAKHGIDPFAGARAVLEDSRLNAMFRTNQVPRMLRSLEDPGRRRTGPTW